MIYLRKIEKLTTETIIYVEIDKFKYNRFHIKLHFI